MKTATLQSRDFDIGEAEPDRDEPQFMPLAEGATHDEMLPGASWLDETSLLDFNGTRLRRLTSRIVRAHRSAVQKAVACHDYVRELPFAFVIGGRSLKASDVVAQGCGDSCTKSTLLCALLRGIGFPARIRVVSLPMQMFHGVIEEDPEKPSLYMEHMYVEVLVADSWQCIDTHVVDSALRAAAIARMSAESRVSGYCAHRHGEAPWSGAKSALAYFACNDPESTPLLDWGVFHHPSEFFERIAPCDREGGYLTRHLVSGDAIAANRRIRELRLSNRPEATQ